MSVEDVTLSTSPFYIFNFDQDFTKLYITGAALEEGAWTGTGGTSVFYPREVIRTYAKYFQGLDLCCEHGHTVGKVLAVRETDLGFEIDAVVTHQDTIMKILRKEMRGFSIKATVLTNERRMATKFVNFQEISVVKNPACKTCMINPGVETEDRIAMSDEENEVNEQVEAFTKLHESAVQFKAAQENLSRVLLSATDNNTTDMWSNDENTEEITMSDEQKTEEVTEVVEEKPAPEVEETEEKVETEETPEAEPETEEEEGEEDVEAEDEEETVALSEYEAVKSELDSLKATIEEKDVKIAEMTAQLSAFTAAAQEQEKADRDKLVNSILSVDPNADKGVLDGMTTVQLSAYKKTAEELAKPMVGAEKKSKQDVQLSAPKTKKDSAAAILSYLRGQQNC